MRRIDLTAVALGLLIGGGLIVGSGKTRLAAAEPEVRAVWVHSGPGKSPDEWEQRFKLLAENGFNMVFPHMLSGGLAHYASDVLPRSKLFLQSGDQIEQCCAAAKKYGLQVHIWKVNFMLLDSSQDFVERMRREGRTQVSVDGKPSDWLCPSHPENRKLELESMLEVARKYPVDGLYFDYIRYPGIRFCYCDGCRRRFEAESGRKVTDWPQECFSGSRKEEYNNWRCRQITSLVETISREVRKIRRGIKISAAVFSDYPSCREHQAQDWPEWVKAGYLDFVCPMNYTNDENRFAALVKRQVELIGGRIPLYPGIGALSSHSKLTPEGVLKQISRARSLGASGFVLFHLNAETAETIIPKLGFGRRSAPKPSLLPNPDFTQGEETPLGWTLSGGKGRWVERDFLEVTGSGSDSNQWQCACPLTPGGLYQFRVRARGAGHMISGPDFANCDHQLTPDWAWYGQVFRVPDGPEKEHIIRLGQWHSSDTLQFDAVQLTPVVPVYLRQRRLQLGEGETVRGGKYVFSGQFQHYAGNFHRTLHAASALFNTNRWCFYGNHYVTYRFSLPERKFLAGRIRFCVSYHQRGACVAEVSRDQNDWRKIAEQKGLATVQADLPDDLFPAEVIYLRLRSSDEECAFQVNLVEFSADIDGEPVEVAGRTEFAQIAGVTDKIAVEEIAWEDFKGNRPKLVLTVRNQESEPQEMKLSAVLRRKLSTEEMSGEQPVEDRPLIVFPDAAVNVPARQTQSFSIETGAMPPGENEIRLSLEQSSGGIVEIALTNVQAEYYREDYGRKLAELCSDDVTLWWCEADWKVSRRRAAPTDIAPAVELSAARNDREAAQIVLCPAKELRQLTVSASALNGPAGAIIPGENIQVFRVLYHFVQTPTDKTGVVDEWPDALLPLEKPLSLAGGKNQPFWILVYVPKEAAAGDYVGNLTFQAEGWSAVVPLKLHVWNFSLPERNHLETAIGLHPEYILRYHRLTEEADKRRVWEMYLQNFAEHRISPYIPAPFDPIQVKFLPDAQPPCAELDFSAFDAEMDRILTRYHFTNFRLPLQGMGGGRWHNRQRPQLAGFADPSPQYQAMFADYVKQLEDHLRQKGWLKMAYIYWYDEPEPSDYQFVRAGMERIKKSAPGLPTMLTEQPEEKLAGPIDIWCPVSYMFDLASAKERRKLGERLWWYVCCGPRAPYCTLFIDHPATELRVWLWQTWQREISGILIWAANYWTSRDDFFQNPYEDPMSYVHGSKPEEGQHWGNGDGRFVYPPPAVFEDAAGDKPVLQPPVSSIRWEMLREGIEDYEYLWLLRALLAEKRESLPPDERRRFEVLLEVPREITHSMTGFTKSPIPIYERRKAVAEAIEQLSK